MAHLTVSYDEGESSHEILQEQAQRVRQKILYGSGVEYKSSACLLIIETFLRIVRDDAAAGRFAVDKLALVKPEGRE